MAVMLNPYLSFRDNAREAMEFYRSVFGGKLNARTFAEFHTSLDPSEDDLIMHAALEGDNGIMFMASDTPQRMEYKAGTNFSMPLSGDDDALLRGYWENWRMVPPSPCRWENRCGATPSVC